MGVRLHQDVGGICQEDGLGQEVYQERERDGNVNWNKKMGGNGDIPPLVCALTDICVGPHVAGPSCRNGSFRGLCSVMTLRDTGYLNPTLG